MQEPISNVELTPYFPYFDEIYNAPNERALVACFSKLIKSLGMELFCLFELASMDDHWQQQLVIGTFPKDYLEAFWRERRTYDSSLIRYTKLNSHSFTVTDVLNDADRLTPKERASLMKAAEAGITDGMVYPLKGQFGRVAGLALTGNPDVLSPAQKWLLSSFSVGLYERACTLYHIADPKIEHNTMGSLTERERECLTWIARGKTNWEVAKVLNISTRTVKYHIENAKVKLGTTSRLQAVIIAQRNVEIFL